VIFARLMEVLAPVECLGCGIQGVVLCATCLDAASTKQPALCFQCGCDSVAGKTCKPCLKLTMLAGVSVGAFYGGAVKDMILQMKFHRLRSSDETAAEIVMRCLPKDLLADLVTSVPVSPGRYRERGYNQSELMARAVAQRLGLPYYSLLGRLTSTHQIGLDRSTRARQVAGAFRATKRLEGQRVLLVDDVVTTGATLSECSATLSGAGAEYVWGAVVARH
jgi:ComF family protein